MKARFLAGGVESQKAEMLRMVEMGKLDAMILPACQQAALCPKFKVLGLPFLFSDYQHVYKTLDGNCRKSWERIIWRS